MNYAAGIGDSNPWHFADDRPEGIVAPPMMTWALTWQFTQNRKHHWGDSGISPELGARSVHYTEDLHWTRPLRPGDVLTIEGEIVKLMAHRSGTYVQTEYVGVDAKGDQVFTERVGGMLRGVPCSGHLEDYVERALATEAELPEKPLRTKRLPIHPFAAHVYDGCANIHNPIHTSKAFAHGVGLPDIILHGTATLAFAVREITDTEGGSDPTKIRGLSCTFTGMVYPGTEVELEVLGSRNDGQATEIFFQVLDEDGRKAIRNGRVLFQTA